MMLLFPWSAHAAPLELTLTLTLTLALTRTRSRTLTRTLTLALTLAHGQRMAPLSGWSLGSRPSDRILRTVSEVCTGLKPETMISGVRSLIGSAGTTLSRAFSCASTWLGTRVRVRARTRARVPSEV